MLEIVMMSALLLTLVVNAGLYIGVRRQRALRQPSIGSQPPVSVFKPLCGADADLEANLRTFYEQQYPSYELLFGVQRHDDPAHALVKKLAREYPKVRTVLVFDDSHHAANPKVSNLIGIEPEARYDLMLISDSNIAVDAQYLSTIVAEYQSSNAAIVTNAFRAEAKDTLGSRLESLQLNTFNAGGMSAGNLVVGETLVVGKSMLFKRSELPEGLGGHGDVLAEDQLIGLALVEATGRKAVLSSMVIDNVIAGLSLKAAYRRQRRWCVLRRWLNPMLYFGELFFNTFALGLIALALSPTPAMALAFVAAWLVRTALDQGCERALGVKVSWRDALLTSAARDLMMIIAWASAWFSSTVAWRGVRYRVGAQTKLKAMGTKPFQQSQRIVERWPSLLEQEIIAEAEALANQNALESPQPEAESEAIA
ncbi:MAG: glycosyltransferase [Planctomycetes bacterium]|nr:glycosyltransferase [Planctomycetota bacterium]